MVYLFLSAGSNPLTSPKDNISVMPCILESRFFIECRWSWYSVYRRQSLNITKTVLLILTCCKYWWTNRYPYPFLLNEGPPIHCYSMVPLTHCYTIKYWLSLQDCFHLTFCEYSPRKTCAHTVITCLFKYTSQYFFSIVEFLL